MDEQKKVVSKMDKSTQIISLSGRMTYDFIGEYRGSIEKMIADAKGYILDLSKLEQIDSTGMGVIVNTAKHFIQNRHKLVVVITDELIRELFIISKLDAIFDITATMKDAMEKVNITDEEYWDKVKNY